MNKKQLFVDFWQLSDQLEEQRHPILQKQLWEQFRDRLNNRLNRQLRARLWFHVWIQSSEALRLLRSLG